MLMVLPNLDDVGSQINALWRVIGVPLRIDFTRVQ
jgi:hypothetical protein